MRRRHGPPPSTAASRLTTRPAAPRRAEGKWRGLQMRAARDRGSLSLMIAILFPVLVGLAGLALDGGAKLIQDENTAAAAQEAARAGANAVNTSTAYVSGQFVVNPAQGVAAARAYLVSAGYAVFTVTPAGPRSIRVSVTQTEPTKLLRLVGIDTISSHATAVATLVTGVAAAGR